MGAEERWPRIWDAAYGAYVAEHAGRVAFHVLAANAASVANAAVEAAQTYPMYGAYVPRMPADVHTQTADETEEGKRAERRG